MTYVATKGFVQVDAANPALLLRGAAEVEFRDPSGRPRGQVDHLEFGRIESTSTRAGWREMLSPGHQSSSWLPDWVIPMEAEAPASSAASEAPPQPAELGLPSDSSGAAGASKSATEKE